jgi:hypothetical protein
MTPSFVTSIHIRTAVKCRLPVECSNKPMPVVRVAEPFDHPSLARHRRARANGAGIMGPRE